MNWDWTWVQLLTTAVGLYAVSIALFLIRENRSPQSSFAWLVLMVLFPIGGLVIYTLFGRGWKAFSRRGQLHTLVEGTSLADRLTVVAGHLLQLPPIATTIAGAALCFGIRLVAIRRGWSLPTAN